MRRVLAAGMAVVAVYLAGAVATAVLKPGAGRPLFDGIVPPAAYSWVNPPPELRDSNVPPSPLTTTISLSVKGSNPISVHSADFQITVRLDLGSVPPRSGEIGVNVVAVPKDPATLGSLSSPLVADGNAVLLELRYAPSGTPILALAVPGVMALRFPTGAETMYFSADGRRWSALATSVTTARGTFVLEAPFKETGYFVAVHNPSMPGGGSRLLTPITVLVVGGAAVAALATGLVLRRALQSRR